MERLTRMIGAMGLAAILLIATSVPALAATPYTPVSGTSFHFNKYLIMDAGDTVPNATFSFTVAPGAAIAGDPSHDIMEVFAGPGTPTIADVIFAPTDSTSTTPGTSVDVARLNTDRGGTAGDAVQLDSGEKYATKKATIDFSSASFPEPGIYRYLITETPSAANEAKGIIQDTDTERVLDVYVVDEGSGTLKVDSYVLHTDVGTVSTSSTPATLSDKTDGFTNEYISKDLKVEKEVTGNQGSRDKYFEFTVSVAAGTVVDTDTFAVSIADDSDSNTNDGNADATSESTAATIAANQGKTNPTTVTGAQLKAGQKFYLHHGQSVVIRGLPQNASYTVNENNEDYQSAVKTGDTNSGVIGTVAGTNKMATAGFTNTRDGVIPTGVFLYAGIGIVLVVLAILGFVLTRKNRKRFTD